ncbi:MAG: hypothetical protein MUF64_12235 [Polyangiaceae bacterium]|jgi:hypothetical protein|nr:hypothetical protein [Polyangiaceae bacterium]
MTRLFPVLALLLCSCSLSLSVDDPQCSVDGDCAARGFQGATCQQQVCVVADPLATDPRWGCGKVAKKQPVSDYTVKLPFIDALSREPIEGVEVTVCSDRDTVCSSPVASKTSGPSGEVVFTLPRTFTGYAQSRKEGYIDAITYLIPREGENLSPPVTLVQPDVFAAIAEAQQIKWEKGTGVIFALALDCQSTPAAGISVSSDPLAPVRFYYDGQLPTLSLDATDLTGQSGLLNLPAPRIITVTGVLSSEQREVSRGQALVRPDTITNFPLMP